MQLKKIVEALLFAAGRSVGVGEILAILESVTEGPQASRGEVQQALEELEKEYRERDGGVRLVAVAEGWEFRTAAGFAPWIAGLNKPRPQRLTTSSIETLAMIAYRQPLTRAEVETVRGVDSAGVLRTLLERRLVRIIGRKEEPGRPLLYATSKEFLELFGLKDLSDLPPLKEFEERIKTAVAETGSEEEFTLADLAATPEELSELEGADQELLSDLDEGLKKEASKKAKAQHAKNKKNNGGERVIHLVTTNAMAETINLRELSAIKSPSKIYGTIKYI